MRERLADQPAAILPLWSTLGPGRLVSGRVTRLAVEFDLVQIYQCFEPLYASSEGTYFRPVI